PEPCRASCRCPVDRLPRASLLPYSSARPHSPQAIEAVEHDLHRVALIDANHRRPDLAEAAAELAERLVILPGQGVADDRHQVLRMIHLEGGRLLLLF